MMYYIINFTNSSDKLKMPPVTDTYTFLLSYEFSKNYEEIFNINIKTDTLKRVRLISRFSCLIRNIEKLFCLLSILFFFFFFFNKIK